jgi:hypothetical protein
MKRALIKLNDSFSGEGNALVTCPGAMDPGALRQAVDHAAMPIPTETPVCYFDKLQRMGGVVEEFIEAAEKQSPSAQYRTSPDGEVLDVSTHDQISAAIQARSIWAATFRAGRDRLKIRDAGRRIGCAGSAWRGQPFGIDFLAWRNRPTDDWRITALEINLRIVGTTTRSRPELPTGGHLTPPPPVRVARPAREHYRATDNLRSERYRGILPRPVRHPHDERPAHSHRTESGVLP